MLTSEFLVPRTHILANIAAEYPILQLGSHLDRNRAAMLNGPIRDATARIESIAWCERARRAEIETTRAGATVVRCHLVRREIEIGQNLSEQNPRAVLTMKQVGILAEPTDAAEGRPLPFQHRT